MRWGGFLAWLLRATSATLLQGASSQLSSATVPHVSGRRGAPRSRERLNATARKQKPGVGGTEGMKSAEKEIAPSSPPPSHSLLQGGKRVHPDVF